LNYWNIEYRNGEFKKLSDYKASIYRTIGYGIMKKLLVAHLCRIPIPVASACPVVGFLDELYLAKPAQLSDHTGPAGYILCGT
jgi:hypothetical protein